MVALAGVLAGACAASPKPAAENPAWRDEGELMTACIDLEDKLVRFFADDYVRDEKLKISPDELEAFYGQWQEELAKSGALDKWRGACLESMTRARYRCAMRSQSVAAFTTCVTGGRR